MSKREGKRVMTLVPSHEKQERRRKRKQAAEEQLRRESFEQAQAKRREHNRLSAQRAGVEHEIRYSRTAACAAAEDDSDAESIYGEGQPEVAAPEEDEPYVAERPQEQVFAHLSSGGRISQAAAVYRLGKFLQSRADPREWTRASAVGGALQLDLLSADNARFLGVLESGTSGFLIETARSGCGSLLLRAKNKLQVYDQRDLKSCFERLRADGGGQMAVTETELRDAYDGVDADLDHWVAEGKLHALLCKDPKAPEGQVAHRVFFPRMPGSCASSVSRELWAASEVPERGVALDRALRDRGLLGEDERALREQRAASAAAAARGERETKREARRESKKKTAFVVVETAQNEHASAALSSMQTFLQE